MAVVGEVLLMDKEVGWQNVVVFICGFKMRDGDAVLPEEMRVPLVGSLGGSHSRCSASGGKEGMSPDLQSTEREGV